jgi:hypothetical protein
VVHTFGKIWMERGLINSKGQDLICGELIQQLLESLKLPEEIAIVHVPGHQKGINFETQGNSFADETAKQAAFTSEVQVFCLILHLPTPHVTLIFTSSEEEQLKNLGGVRTEQRKWVLINGREKISKPLMRELLTYLHQERHWGPQAMCNAVLQAYRCIGIYTLAKQVPEGCLTC